VNQAKHPFKLKNAIKMKYFFLAITMLGVMVSNAQRVNLNTGIDINTPLSKDLGEIAGVGYGLSLRAQVGFVEDFSIIVTTGIQTFSKEDTESKVTILPFQMGLKYALNKTQKAKFYTSIEGGIHNVSISNINYDNGTTFSYALGFGVQIQAVDLGGKFQLMDKNNNFGTNYFNLRLGFNL